MAKTSKSIIEENLIRTLANLLEETGLSEIEYGKDGLSIRVAKPVMTSPAAKELTREPSIKPDLTVHAEDVNVDEKSMLDHPGAVKSPMVGVIYTAPEPNAPPFVRPGEQVSEGQTLFLIEAMKVFNPILAPKTGKIIRILVDSEMPVEFGEPLAIIE